MSSVPSGPLILEGVGLTVGEGAFFITPPQSFLPRERGLRGEEELGGQVIEARVLGGWGGGCLPSPSRETG